VLAYGTGLIPQKGHWEGRCGTLNKKGIKMTIFKCILLGFLIVCAIAASLSKKLLNTILIFMSYSLIMSIIWILLESPDLAITEAAVGAGVTTVLFLVTLKKINAIIKKEEEKKEETGKEEEKGRRGR